MANLAVQFGPGGLSPPSGRRRRRNANRRDPAFEQAAVQEGDRIKRYLSEYKSLYKYEAPIANGSHGMVILASTREQTDPPFQYFTVKRAYSESGVEYLENEIKVLERLRGAAHILQKFDIDPNPFEAMTRPALIAEYAGNGTLETLIRELSLRGRPLPNRVLWHWFACLLRACIAMAWPDRGEPGAKPANEEFPPDWQQKPREQLMHCNIRPENICIGELEPPVNEHLLVPALKLVGWSHARVDNNPYVKDIGVSTNIFHIGRIMRMLITYDMTWELEPRNAIITVDGGARLFQTASSCIAEPNYPNLDDDLRNIVLLCTATDPKERPSLEWLAKNITENINTKDSSFYKYEGYPYYRNERTYKIQNLMHEAVFYSQ
ncbi:kinase-like protein [Xylariaceae sp. FL0804]|nr:kinase-like protein [Xylariaceae sp. FL0804]